MAWQERIDRFLAGAPHAVVGASPDRRKYGNMVLRAFLQAQRPVYAINPRVAEVEGVASFASLVDLPEAVHGVSIITPPHVTDQIIAQAASLGIQHIWLQPGAESETAIARGEAMGANLIAGGPCVLIALGFHA